MTNDTQKHSDHFADTVVAFAKACWQPIVELYYGTKTRTLPLMDCLCGAALVCLILRFHLDHFLFSLLKIGFLYPTNGRFAYAVYAHFLIIGPFWLWGLYQAGARQKLIRNLTEVFGACGLKNGLGKLPAFLSDRPVDEYSRKLRLTTAGLAKQNFDAVRPQLQAHLRKHIDEVTHDINAGVIEITYSSEALPTMTKIEEVREIPRWHFVVGKARGRQISESLLKVPHLLVAGQTGGGKSTFLSSFITTLYLNNKDCRFTLIDLKGGMELSLFQNLERVKLLDNIKEAVSALSFFDQQLQDRMKLLRANKCRDLEAFVRLPKTKRVRIEAIEESRCQTRHVVVIDEAAELFLAGVQANAKNVQDARRILSQIARLGRSVGIHLVVATQRPDTRSLDPQVKANLPGVVCFQMVNDASSISVLGSGRATELPAIPGRAIWKCGAQMIEVQVPYLTASEIADLLKINPPTEVL